MTTGEQVWVPWPREPGWERAVYVRHVDGIYHVVQWPQGSRLQATHPGDALVTGVISDEEYQAMLARHLLLT